MERLSPNMRRRTTAADTDGQIKTGFFSLMPAAMGASAAMVPMEVPMDRETKQLITNRTDDRDSRREQRQPQINRAVYAACSGDGAGKSAGCQKDQTHGDDVVIADSPGGNGQLFVEGLPRVLQKSHDQRDQKTDDGQAWCKSPAG